jgi:hypothetical protein
MSTTPTASTSRSNLDSIFTSAFQAYKKKTGKDITSHPLATELQSCNSIDTILAVLQGLVPAREQSQNSDEGTAKWLIPTVNVLYAFSATLAEGVGLVNITMSPLSSVCSNISLAGILSSKSDLYGNRHPPLGQALLNALEQPILTSKLARRRRTSAPAKKSSPICSTASEISFCDSRFTLAFRPTTAMTDIIVQIMVEVLTVLGIATKEVKRGRLSELNQRRSTIAYSNFIQKST